MNTVTRFQLRSASHLFLVKDDKILLARRKGAWKAGFYGVPAGHLDGEETARDAMVREAKEEIGLDIAKEDMRLVHVMHRKSLDAEYIDFFFTTESWKGNLENLEPEKCDDLRWFAFGSLPENTVTYIRQAIGDFQKGITYSETGWSNDAE